MKKTEEYKSVKECPLCLGETKVTDSRTDLKTGTIRRKRKCIDCGNEFKTQEIMADDNVKVDEVVGYMQSEITRAEKRMEIKDNIFYDGAVVGLEQQQVLNKSHIRFCKTILKMLGVEE